MRICEYRKPQKKRKESEIENDNREVPYVLHIVICDDDKKQTKLLQEWVEQWAVEGKRQVQIDTCFNAEQFFFLYEDNRDTDILLLDIEMPGMNGVELARKLRQGDEETQIIFTTGNRDYVFEGYELDAVSYLLKPFDSKALTACLEKAYKRLAVKEPVLFAETEAGTVKIKYHNIVAFESRGHGTIVYHEYQNGDKTSAHLKVGIHELEERVKEDERFFKCHRSYLLNLQHIERIGKKEVTMDDGSLLPIARGKWEELNCACLRFYRKGKEQI